jgi:hypothetical protein
LGRLLLFLRLPQALGELLLQLLDLRALLLAFGERQSFLQRCAGRSLFDGRSCRWPGLRR